MEVNYEGTCPSATRPSATGGSSTSANLFCLAGGDPDAAEKEDERVEARDFFFYVNDCNLKKIKIKG